MIFGPITHCDAPALRDNLALSCNMRVSSPRAASRQALRGVLHTFIAAMLLALATSLLAGEPDSKNERGMDAERIDTLRSGTNGRTWHARFDARLLATHVAVTLRIKLVQGPGISRPQLERLKNTWEEDVERYWSDQFALHYAGSERPIRLDLQFDNPDPHYTVVVTDNASVHANPLRWSRYANARVIAHEIGHMLGAYDEYAAGGQNPDRPQSDPLSLMGGAANSQAKARAHHFDLIVQWAATRSAGAKIAPVGRAAQVLKD